MKNYNEKNYERYKEDIKKSQPVVKPWTEYTTEELIIKFLPMVESISRSFNTSDTSSGVLDIMDLIQYGSIGLIAAVGKLDVEVSMSKDDPERSIKSFLAKRIKGAIRRSVDNNRGTMRVTEYRQNEIRKSRNGVELIFNSVFKSIDAYDTSSGNPFYNIPEIDKTYNIDMLNSYLLNVMKQILDVDEYNIVRLFYGLDCPRQGSKAIAKYLGMNNLGGHSKISSIKKYAIEKIITKINVESLILFE